MKQHITVDQVNELSPEAQDTLWKWWTPREEDAVLEGDGRMGWAHNHSWIEGWELARKEGQAQPSKAGWFPQLSIGQMIEFLKEQTFLDLEHRCFFNKIFWSDLRDEWVVRFLSETGEGIVEFNDTNELADALWDAVKAALEET
jgi:hypothetical protein